MANIKISELNALTERADNDLLAIVDTSADETKKIQVYDLINKNIELIAVSDTAPSECSIGDKYYNTTDKEIYTATGTNAWSETGTTPISGILYIVYNEQASYSWDGTDLVSVGGGKEDIVIDDEEPTDPDVKLWIDTGEVGSLGNEVSVGATQPTNGEKVWFKTSKNLFDYSKSINGYISATGEFNTSNTNMLSDYIETESNKQYIASTYTNVYGINIAEFDSSKAFIKRTMSSSNVKENSITTSSTTKYIRVWFNIDNSTTMNINSLTNIKAQILYGDIATTYEPYINKQIYTNQNGNYNEFYSENNTTKYSTNEIRIGTWIDGKPIYRRVYTTAITGGTTATIDTITDADTLVNCYGTFLVNSGATVNLIYYSNENDRGHYWFTASKQLRYNSPNSGTAIAIVEYTKPTD